MKPEKFVEIFKAAIALYGKGIPLTWIAHSPLVMAHSSNEPQTDREKHFFGDTPGEAIHQLVLAAIDVRYEKVKSAKAELRAAEDNWSLIKANALLFKL